MDDMFFSAASKKPSIQLLSKYVYFCSIKVARDKVSQFFEVLICCFPSRPPPSLPRSRSLLASQYFM